MSVDDRKPLTEEKLERWRDTLDAAKSKRERDEALYSAHRPSKKTANLTFLREMVTAMKSWMEPKVHALGNGMYARLRSFGDYLNARGLCIHRYDSADLECKHEAAHFYRVSNKCVKCGERYTTIVDFSGYPGFSDA